MGASARTPVVLAVVAVLALALLSLIPPSTATYDPWAWIVWGRESIHGDLNTVDGPSWKPLPVVVTSIAALFGGVAPDLWVLTARVGALGAVVVAFVLGRRVAGTVAGLLAAAPLALAPWFFWHGWLANSEGLLVLFVLGAVLAELQRRRGVAMACGVAAALLRPEAWPFLLLYAAWVAWHADLRGRLWVLGALVILPPAWLLPEKWGSGDFNRASSRAQNPDPGAPSLTEHPWLTILGNFSHMLPATVWAISAVAAVLAVGTAVRARRAGARSTGPDRAGAADGALDPSSAGGAPADGASAAGLRRLLERGPLAAIRGPWAVVLGLFVFGLAWLALVAIMTERGYSGNERYLIQPAALLIVAAGTAAGLVLRGLARAPRTALVVVALAGFVVAAVSELPEQVRSVLHEGRLVHDLPDAIAAAGGADRLKACGDVSTLNLMVPQVAWALREHAVDVKDAKFARTRVVLRLRLTEGDILRPSVGRVPSMPVLARTDYWQIEAAGCPATSGRTR
jgi:hypothetical protein